MPLSRGLRRTMITETLTDLEVFSSLSTEEASRVRRLMKRRKGPENRVPLREGDESHVMHIVLSGTVAVSISTDNEEDVEVSRIGEGSFFGEISILQRWTTIPQSRSRS